MIRFDSIHIRFDSYVAVRATLLFRNSEFNSDPTTQLLVARRCPFTPILPVSFNMSPRPVSIIGEQITQKVGTAIGTHGSPIRFQCPCRTVP
mmetsp:Transcript_15451/g.25765  ORF Transcript_15451/g.25765 Transcript_15451/m.25765 type:complete len:92 (-) Transcript_15451:331-606(-)